MAKIQSNLRCQASRPVLSPTKTVEKIATLIELFFKFIKNFTILIYFAT